MGQAVLGNRRVRTSGCTACALAQGNRDICLANLMQPGETSAEEEVIRQPSGIVALILQENGIKGDHTAEVTVMRLELHPRPGQSRRRGTSNRTSAPKTDGAQTYDNGQTSFRCTMIITQNEAIHYQPPRNRRWPSSRD